MLLLGQALVLLDCRLKLGILAEGSSKKGWRKHFQNGMHMRMAGWHSASPCPIGSVITPEGQAVMSKLIFNIFSPALALDKIIKGVSPRTMLLWWPIPAFVGVCQPLEIR